VVAALTTGRTLASNWVAAAAAAAVVGDLALSS